MSFVPVKGLDQQGLSMLHSARSQLIGQRTQLINGVRGHLSEFGIIAARGLLGLAEPAAIVRDESDKGSPQQRFERRQGQQNGLSKKDVAARHQSPRCGRCHRHREADTSSTPIAWH